MLTREKTVLVMQGLREGKVRRALLIARPQTEEGSGEASLVLRSDCQTA